MEEWHTDPFKPMTGLEDPLSRVWGLGLMPWQFVLESGGKQVHLGTMPPSLIEDFLKG